MRPRKAPIAVLTLLMTAWGASPTRGQDSETAVERLKAMGADADLPGGLAKSKDKDKPPFEFFRSQVPPFDVLPYVKPHQWFTLNMEMQANLGNYDGFLQTTSEVGGRPQVALRDAPNRPVYHAMVYRRRSNLVKEQKTRQGLQMLLPEHLKELNLELTRADAIRPDGLWAASLLKLETQQMLIPVLAPDPNLYDSWKRFQATLPASGDRESAGEIDKQRYYRMAIPLTDRPILSANPLTWTGISHVIWDALPPGNVQGGAQDAMIDWLHFGGQLIVVASGPNAVAPLEESFLAPYLPASVSGRNATLTGDDLLALSKAYPPPASGWADESETIEGLMPNRRAADQPRYKAAEPIRPAPGKPLFVTGLEPRPGAIAIPLGDPGGHPLAVEWRVGRGRVLMLAVNPNDPALAAWTGMDTLVRRVLLRRVEEGTNSDNERRTFGFLGGPDLTWVRLMGRDLGVEAIVDPNPEDPDSPSSPMPVAAWIDTWAGGLPVLARGALEEASGITIPGSSFVKKVILSYIFVLVPLNWLVCRFVFNRREWAWAAVPFLALGFAVSVERAAAYDVGFDSDCSEINVLEIQGGYPRGHLSRFASLYSTGRDKFTISYPNDPSALALPLNQERSLRGEEAASSVFESFPEPALTGFQVQPRSLATFRAEAIVELGGTIRLTGDASSGRIDNTTPMDLHDAVLIDTAFGTRTPLGTLGAGESFEIGGASRPSSAKPAIVDWTDVAPFLEKLENFRWDIPSERGALRLVGWVADPHPGQVLTPAVDRHRGFRVVAVHLRPGPPPDPAGPSYFDNEHPDPEQVRP